MTNLSERASRSPESWKPEPGDVLEGELTELNYRDSEYGNEPYPVLTILDNGGKEWAFHAFHTWARLEVDRKKPQVGERIAVAYHGLGEAQPGMQPPHRYRLVVDRPRPEQREFVPADEAGSEEKQDYDDIPF
jgi:hypothetical protein